MLVKDIEHTIIDLMTKNSLKTYYDIGASLTQKSLILFETLIKYGIDIYAFEPNPITYNNLRDTFGKNVSAFNIGIGNKDEIKDLYSIEHDLYLSSFSKEFIIKKNLMQDKKIRYLYYKK